MSEHTDALLAELLDVQRRILALQETTVANQREALGRQKQVLRRILPLVVLLIVVAVGPYAWNLIAFLTHH